MSILNLPIEQQKRIAAAVGVPYNQWVRQVRKDLDRIKSQPHPSKKQPSPRAVFLQARMDAETPHRSHVFLP